MTAQNEKVRARAIVTGPSLYGGRRTVSALRKTIPGATIQRTAFQAVFIVEDEGNSLQLAERINRECFRSIGRAVALLAEVESEVAPIREEAIDIGATQIGEEESFCFRLHKRGLHGIEQATPEFEYETGGAIWVALHEKYGRKPRIDLKFPDVYLLAEVLGHKTALGILRKSWREIEETTELGN